MLILTVWGLVVYWSFVGYTLLFLDLFVCGLVFCFGIVCVCVLGFGLLDFWSLG